ncbi:stealth family protein [Streptococcus danieliae]|uniref:stealth family protein n=1 Tax=Streptococcus danieliae TaxID=747656 RepID=UPI0026F28F24|nr:stealth family protein [Streptococcus danieliae]
MQNIDFVITWVDGNDEEWLNKKNKFDPRSGDRLNTKARYRDWKFLKYWFRSVEQNAPWVHKVVFVTEGHLPEWLNTSCEKLLIVKHSDYIDSKYLPTFNSNVIELNFHRIQGLSDLFVNFNDDMFLNKPVSPSDFFDNQLPRDIGVFSPIVPTRHAIASIVLNNVEIINDYFSSRSILKNHSFKFFRVHYGKHLLKNFCVLPWSKVLGFYDNHIPVSYNKSTFEVIWEKEGELLQEVSSHKFRQSTDLNHWLMRYWQLCTGAFSPRATNFGQYYNLSNEFDNVLQDIRDSRHAVICLNDSDDIDNFEQSRNRLLKEFEEKYPTKSIFER